MSQAATLPTTRKPIIAHSVLGTLIFVCTEVMFFIALVSAYLVIKSTKGSWVPPADIRLPILATSFNTFLLLLSGLSVYFSKKNLSIDSQKAQVQLGRAVLFGGLFVFFQGYEWVQLVGYGMTMSSGIFGASFYLLIGSHGLHAFAGVFVLAWAYLRLRQRKLDINQITSVQIFWYFIVGIWPLLFGLVYF